MRFPFDPRVKTGLIIFLCLSGIFALTSQEILLITALFLTVFHLAFFRDPHRLSPPGNDPVSPADGKIVDVAECYEPHFLKEEAVRVSIFLSIFNAHVNRSPLAGIVEYQRYEPGKFLNALKKDSIKKNECNWIGVASLDHKALVRQVSGTLARKIFWDVKVGQGVDRGSKMGIICYGSRTEFFAPKRLFKSRVQIGDNVKAGETILGEWLK